MGNITNNTSTVIQVTPATPLQLNEKEKLSSSTILDNLLDELQTISKQSMPNQTSISNSSSIGGDDPIDHRSSSTPNHQRQKSSIQSTKTLNASDSDTIIRRGI
ncbi:hypothetical protein SSS_10579 [Sarcoptes scabiei]|nr:hypothetical protein SSS_10579 [Sarcoptes scabiei]